MKITLALAALVAFLAAAAIPVVRAQQLPRIHFEPAPGPAIQYKVRVRTLTATTVYLSNYPHEPVVTTVELRSLPEEPYWIDAAAVDPLGYTRQWGDYTPHTADLDESDMVGAGDVIRLSQEWGQPDRGAAMFLEIVQRWGDATVWDTTLEVRRYE